MTNNNIKKVRFVRILEYTYGDVLQAERDFHQYSVPLVGVKKFGATTVRSAVTPMEVLSSEQESSD